MRLKPIAACASGGTEAHRAFPAHSPTTDPMTTAERRTGAVLAAIFGLRMLGLFLVLPVFSVLAAGMPGGEDVMLVGLALGAYGLTQAFLQILSASPPTAGAESPSSSPACCCLPPAASSPLRRRISTS